MNKIDDTIVCTNQELVSIKKSLQGSVAQLVEQRSYKAKVHGSSPCGSKIQRIQPLLSRFYPQFSRISRRIFLRSREDK